MEIVKKIQQFFSYWYVRYLLVTELYMVDTWEKIVVRILFINRVYLRHVFANPNKFPEQFIAWVCVLSGQDECDLDYTKFKICDRHFTEKDRNRNNRLNALAVPSLFLHDNLVPKPGTSSSRPEVSQDLLMDHNYCRPSRRTHTVRNILFGVIFTMFWYFNYSIIVSGISSLRSSTTHDIEQIL